MKKVALALVLALSLSGCASLQQDIKNAYQVVTTLGDKKVPASAIIVAANAYDGLARTATNYLRLPICNGGSFACRNPAATDEIEKAIISGRQVRNQLKDFIRQHPGELGSQGLYDALSQSIATIQSIVIRYNIGG